MATTIRVPLDSSYLFERDSSGRTAGVPGPAFPPAGSAPDFALTPFDNVLILKQPQFEFQRTVNILGEVRYPGAYALVKKDDRISDLVQRAGGLLPTAYPGGSQFIRTFAKAGRVNIDLAGIVAGPKSSSDIILQPGDSLVVPEYIPTVRVEGGVTTPSSVQYREGADLDYYIDNAGGFTRLADKGRVSVRYANGSARVRRSHLLFFHSTPVPGPGSVVQVPTKPEGKTDVGGTIASIAQIVTTAATVVIVALRL
jgi:protein involved in polysaccharide export with SLBB domain